MYLNVSIFNQWVKKKKMKFVLTQFLFLSSSFSLVILGVKFVYNLANMQLMQTLLIGKGEQIREGVTEIFVWSDNTCVKYLCDSLNHLLRHFLTFTWIHA